MSYGLPLPIYLGSGLASAVPGTTDPTPTTRIALTYNALCWLSDKLFSLFRCPNARSEVCDLRLLPSVTLNPSPRLRCGTNAQRPLLSVSRFSTHVPPPGLVLHLSPVRTTRIRNALLLNKQGTTGAGSHKVDLAPTRAMCSPALDTPLPLASGMSRTRTASRAVPSRQNWPTRHPCLAPPMTGLPSTEWRSLHPTMLRSCAITTWLTDLRAQTPTQASEADQSSRMLNAVVSYNHGAFSSSANNCS